MENRILYKDLVKEFCEKRELGYKISKTIGGTCVLL